MVFYRCRQTKKERKVVPALVYKDMYTMKEKKDDFNKREKNFSDNVYSIMRKKKMSQKKFAKEIGISENTLKSYLVNWSIDNIKYDTVMKICELGEVYPEELFGKQMNQNDLEMSELLREVSKLSDEEKNLVNGVMKEVLNYAKRKNSMNDTKSKK